MPIMKRTRMSRGRFPIRAFSLLESLIALLVSLILLEIFAVGINRSLQLARSQLFLLNFENLYQATQERAVYLRQKQEIKAEAGWLRTEREQVKAPLEVHLKDFSIVFNEEGRNTSLKKIEMELPYEKKKVDYQLGFGNGRLKKKIR